MIQKNEVDILLTFTFWTRVKILFGIPVTVKYRFNGAEDVEVTSNENGEINISCKPSVQNSQDLIKSVTILSEELGKDPGFYYAYQANIAMAFKDEYERWIQRVGRLNTYDYLHEIANQSAKNFLDAYINLGK